MNVRFSNFILDLRSPTRAFLIALFVGLYLAGSPLKADDNEHNFEEALEAGEVMPLDRLLARISQDVRGRVLKVELERETDDERSRWIYEAKVLTPKGHVLKLEYDAETLELLGIKGRHKHHRLGDDDRKSGGS